MLLSTTSTAVLVFIFVEVYRLKPNVWTTLALAVTPNIIGVLVVFLVLERLRVYGLSEAHDQLDAIQEFLETNVNKLAAEIEVINRMHDAPWRDIFSEPGPVGIIANFSTLPLNSGKTSLRNNFQTMRSGHVIVLADPDVASTLAEIAASRISQEYASTADTVKTAICNTIALLLDAIPDNSAASENSPIPGIKVLLSPRMLGVVCIWTAGCAYFSGLQSVKDDDVAVCPRLLAFGNSSISIRNYGREVVQRVSSDCREPTLKELLDLGSTVRDAASMEKLKRRIIQ